MLGRSTDPTSAKRVRAKQNPPGAHSPRTASEKVGSLLNDRIRKLIGRNISNSSNVIDDFNFHG